MYFSFLEAGADSAFSNISFIAILAVMGVLMYFMMYRPNKKKEKQAAEMRNSLEVGDEVTTIGGIVGRVVSLKEDTFVIETGGDRSRMRFKRWAIQEVGKLNLEGDTAPQTQAASPEVKSWAERRAEKKAEKQKGNE